MADTVKHHVIPVAKIVSTDLDAGELKVGGLQGSELTVTVATGDGVIHIIDNGPPASFKLSRHGGHDSRGRKVRHIGCRIDEGQTGRCTER